MRERGKKGEEGSPQEKGLKVRGEEKEDEEEKEEEEVTETDAEHENGLCHPFSNTEPEDKGSVSASRFFQHLLDDNSYLSPHQREARGERRKYTTHCSSCLFLFARFSSQSSSISLFIPPPPPSSISQRHRYTNTLKHSFSPSACRDSK